MEITERQTNIIEPFSQEKRACKTMWQESVKHNLGFFFLPQDKLNALSEWCGTNDTKQDNMNILHAPIAEKYQRKAGEQWNLSEVKSTLRALTEISSLLRFVINRAESLLIYGFNMTHS